MEEYTAGQPAVYDPGYAKQTALEVGIGRYVPQTDRQKLQLKKAALQAELTRVEAAIAALDAHPELEEFTKVLQAALR